MKNRKFIFNVGHGLTPECKIKNVKNVINIAVISVRVGMIQANVNLF